MLADSPPLSIHSDAEFEEVEMEDVRQQHQHSPLIKDEAEATPPPQQPDAAFPSAAAALCSAHPPPLPQAPQMPNTDGLPLLTHDAVIEYFDSNRQQQHQQATFAAPTIPVPHDQLLDLTVPEPQFVLLTSVHLPSSKPTPTLTPTSTPTSTPTPTPRAGEQQLEAATGGMRSMRIRSRSSDENQNSQPASPVSSQLYNEAAEHVLRMHQRTRSSEPSAKKKPRVHEFLGFVVHEQVQLALIANCAHFCSKNGDKEPSGRGSAYIKVENFSVLAEVWRCLKDNKSADAMKNIKRAMRMSRQKERQYFENLPQKWHRKNIYKFGSLSIQHFSRMYPQWWTPR